MKHTVVILFVILCLSCSSSYQFNPQISFLTGDVKINGTPVSTGTKVKLNDRIETAADSICEITINEKSILRLGAKSLLLFNMTESDNSLILEKGWLSGLTRQKFNKLGKYYVRTPSVVSAVRGTSFCVKVESPEETYFCVCNGKIDLSNLSGQKYESVSSSHHEGRRFIKDQQGSIRIEKLGLLYHSDKDIEHLAGKINEKIDWNSVDRR